MFSQRRPHRPRGTVRPWQRRRSRPVSRVLSWTAIPLGPASRLGSSNQPGSDAGNVIAPLFSLAPGGVCRAMRRWPRTRCALTAPFHPCHACLSTPFGGLFSVALSVGSRRPGVTWHLALWSPDFPRHAMRDAAVWPTPARSVARGARKPCRARSPSKGTVPGGAPHEAWHVPALRSSPGKWRQPRCCSAECRMKPGLDKSIAPAALPTKANVDRAPPAAPDQLSRIACIGYAAVLYSPPDQASPHR